MRRHIETPREQIIEQVRGMAERMAASGGKRVTITPESALLLAHALRVYADMLSRPVEDYPNFTVDVWDDERDVIVETLARCSSFLVAKAAYVQAVKERPQMRVTLRQGIRLVAERGTRDVTQEQTT